MLFNSIDFAIFLPIVFILYWSVSNKYKWVVLLISSYYFYMQWNVKYVTLILFTTVVSYIAAIVIQKSERKNIKKLCLSVTLVVSLGILFVFKYYNFFLDSLIGLLSHIGVTINYTTLNILLPVGISFYTFQTLGYVIDVYRGDASCEYNFGKYAAFIAFFPQLVAGPIERTRNLLPQISCDHKLDYKKASYGLKLIAWGLFKKIIIADTLAQYVDKVYNNLGSYNGFVLVLATVFFAIQIYCDFSGYSDIAVGVAKLFDIDLMNNFASPYFANSIKNFWSRWHISLSTWFKDYVYIPLGGNRCSKLRHYFNLFTTFIISGLWHGANWTYIIWGAIHGGGQVLENMLTRNKKNCLPKRFNWCSVLFVVAFVTVAWVFFRATTLGDALYVFENSFEGILNPLMYLKSGIGKMTKSIEDIIEIGIMVTMLFTFDYFNTKNDVIEKISSLKTPVRWCTYVIFVLLMLYLLPATSGGEFIYFQF